MNKYYPNLFKPLVLKNGSVMKNRIETSPTHHMTAGTPPDYHFNQIGEEIYGERAAGGAGLVTIGEGKMGDMTSCGHRSHIQCCTDDSPFTFHRYTTLLHGYDCLASIEFSHAGHFARKDPMSASPFKTPQGWYSREMNEEDMLRVAEEYANAVATAYRSGFDVVCLHFAHGWLMGGFLSPLINHRTDKYGGSIENRCRFPLMVLDHIREKVGNKIALEVRLSSDEFTPGGLQVEEVAEIAKIIEDKIDLLHVSCGTRLNAITRAIMHPSHFIEHGHNKDRARIIKNAVSIPVGVVGAITDPFLADKMIEEEYCDYVCLARQFIADPDWGEKARHGKADDIRPCIKCFHCLDVSAGRVNTSTKAVLDNPMSVELIECSVNPLFGDHEIKKSFKPSSESKNVVVIGGGVGGMQAALTAAERGHHVTLFEKADKLGGQLFYTDYIWFKKDMKKYRDYLIHQISKAAIDVRLNCEATAEAIEKNNPDAVIVAVGADPVIPNISGVENSNVLTAIDVFGKENSLGEKVTIIGGGMVGCELSLHLTHLGHQVDLIEMGEILAPDAVFTERMHTLDYIEKEEKLNCHTSSRCVAITETGVQIESPNGEISFIEADNIVLSVGFNPRKNIARSFEDSAPDVFFIGDCKKVGTIFNAVHNGFDAASRI